LPVDDLGELKKIAAAASETKAVLRPTVRQGKKKP